VNKMDDDRALEVLQELQSNLLDAADQLPEPMRTSTLACMVFRKALTPETDRGCALMAAAYLDERLKLLLQSRLVFDKKYVRRALDFNGPLGTFSSRIDFAYLLGLIPKNAQRDLHLMRKIRNEFAHVASSLNFESESVSAECKKFYFDGVVPEAPARSKFTRAAMGLLSFIDVAIFKTSHIEAAPDHDISTDQAALRGIRSQLEAAGIDGAHLPDFIDYGSRG